MSRPVTIRERVLDALVAARPGGLTMAALAGAVNGAWRARDVEATVRRLWDANELARRPDGTFIATEGAPSGDRANARGTRGQLDAAVRRVARDGRREGHSTAMKVRTVDAALLRAWCPRCRATVNPRLDGTCVRCGTQCGANVEDACPPRRRRRRKPLRQGQPGFATVCRCGAPKSKQAHACRACSTKRRSGRQLGPRPNRRRPVAITDEQLLEARRLYASGLSLRQIAKRIHPETGYKSVASCAEGLYSLFKVRGWKLRPQAEVTRARNIKHGRKSRAATREQEHAYRRWLARERGWTALTRPGNPICKGVKKQHPGKGRPCEHRALDGSEYCWLHDPRFELERQAQAARMRARISRMPMLPAAPFSAWLRRLHGELGRWKDVGELTGLGSAAHRWGNGQTSAGTPLERVSVRVATRSAERAGTTIQAIYDDVDLKAAA